MNEGSAAANEPPINGSKNSTTVTFSEEAYEALTRLAKMSNTSIPEVLRKAIAFEEWYQKELYQNGGRLFVERDNKLHQVFRPR
jgi:predicted transcriptional regulator